MAAAVKASAYSLACVQAKDLLEWKEDAEAFHHAADVGGFQENLRTCAETLYLSLFEVVEKEYFGKLLDVLVAHVACLFWNNADNQCEQRLAILLACDCCSCAIAETQGACCAAGAGRPAACLRVRAAWRHRVPAGAAHRRRAGALTYRTLFHVIARVGQ